MTRRWVSPVEHDRTRLVMIFRFWYLTGSDRTLVLVCPVTLSSTSDHYLNVLMTIEIGRSAFEARVTWHASHDRTLGPVSGRSDRRVRSSCFLVDCGANGSISWGLLFKPHGRLKLTLLAICIDIATL